MPEALQFLPVYILLAILPLGVAGQNIGTGLVFLLLAHSLYKKRHQLPVRRLWSDHQMAILTVGMYLLLQILATVRNPASPVRFSFTYTFGYLTWALLPPLLYLAIPRLPKDVWRKIEWTFAAMSLVLGVISLSQSIWGWRIAQTDIELGFPRAQGFYSHPMTFGYVCLVLVPYGINALFREPRRVLSWVTAVSLAVAIFTSRSRMVEVVTALVLLWNIWCRTRGRTRLMILAVCAVAAAIILTTENPVGERFRGTLHRQDVRSDYLDDRVAFWHVHWNMLQEHPLIGHGEGIITSYRAPYYEAIGLKDFERQYEAHNMFLQMAVNIGLIGLGVFLAWLFDFIRFARGLKKRGFWSGTVALQTILALCLGSLTQNAFQDAAVRFAITVMIGGLWLWARDYDSKDEGHVSP